MVNNGIPEDKLLHITQGLPIQEAFKNKTLDHSGILKFVFVGRINKLKGVFLLIEAVRQLGNKGILVDIYGQEDEIDFVDQCKKVTCGMKNIQWKGVIPPHKMVETLTGYDCLCVPSIICEMSPLVIQEAFAAGIPVLASDVNGNAEQIDNCRNGWLFKSNDCDDLKEKLIKLVDNPNLIEVAKREFKPVKTFKTVADEYEQLYNNVIANSQQ